MNKILEFIKNEIVFVIATILAIISSFIVTPSKDYFDYVDFRVLVLLFSLMIVVAGFKSIGVFDYLAKTAISKLKTIWQIIYLLLFLCFFLGMFITNDVALIVFVPFTIMVLHMLHHDDLLIVVIVLQTLAANLGSMLTPLGNPQNLYIYSKYNMSIGNFLLTMLPVTVLAFMLLVISITFIKNEEITIDINDDVAPINKLHFFLYLLLFLLCILTVLHVINFLVLLGIIVIAIVFINYTLFKEVDYMLLLTFVAFFIFIGNMGNIDVIKNTLESIVKGREFVLGIVSSQIISNVPATILLSNFTYNSTKLLLGVNIGSLGTLIASMASLISYKLYANQNGSNKLKYIATFTAINVLYLLVYIFFFSIGL